MALFVAGCPSDQDHPRASAGAQAGVPDKDRTGASIVSAAHLGQRVTVVGWAVNRPVGAELVGSDFSVWIDGLGLWPEGYYSGGDRGKRVKVTGVLAEDQGLPVFIPKKGELPRQGIPVPEGTDLHKASHRYLLEDAMWEPLED
jgi:hypothetical protein